MIPSDSNGFMMTSICNQWDYNGIIRVQSVTAHWSDVDCDIM
jgi:hypothetical protein